MAAKATEKTSLAHVKLLPLILVVVLGAVIWLIPPPQGVKQEAWHLLAIFVATVLGFIVKPLPMGAVAIIGIMTTSLTGTLSIGNALSGFSNNVIWLIGAAFFISRAVIKTGLGARIAYHLMKLLGKKIWGSPTVWASPISSWRRPCPAIRHAKAASSCRLFVPWPRSTTATRPRGQNAK